MEKAPLNSCSELSKRLELDPLFTELTLEGLASWKSMQIVNNGSNNSLNIHVFVMLLFRHVVAHVKLCAGKSIWLGEIPTELFPWV